MATKKSTNQTPAVTMTQAVNSLAGVFSCTFTVSAKAKVITERTTLQRGETPTGLGKAWHQGCKPATNSRHTAISALAALGETFSYAQATAALAALPKAVLGSGTPRSYLVAFVKEGYLNAYAA